MTTKIKNPQDDVCYIVSYHSPPLKYRKSFWAHLKHIERQGKVFIEGNYILGGVCFDDFFQKKHSLARKCTFRIQKNKDGGSVSYTSGKVVHFMISFWYIC